MMPAWCIKYPSIHMHLNSCYLFKDIVVNYVLVYARASFIVKWQFVSTSSWCSLHIISIIYSQSEANDGFLCPRLVLWFLHRNRHRPRHFQGHWKTIPRAEQTRPLSPAVRGGAAGLTQAPHAPCSCQRANPRVPKPPPLPPACCCPAGDRAATPTCFRELGVHHVAKATLNYPHCETSLALSVIQPWWRETSPLCPVDHHPGI